jgi:hypothetical protein
VRLCRTAPLCRTASVEDDMFKRVRLSLAILLTAGIAVGSALTGVAVLANGDQPQIIRTALLPDIPLAEFVNSLLPGAIEDDRQIRMGSIGSDIFRQLGDPATEFWAVTDRGPNGQPGGRRTFPVPTFDPMILHLKAHGDRIDILEALPLRNPDGTAVTGLPNVATFDETPWNFDATFKLSGNPNGLDTEGIVRTSDGHFWLVDEYSPSLVHVDRDGYVLERIVPVNSLLTGTSYPVEKSLPEIFNTRRQNRGFEGVALTPDGTTLFIELQSPLENPNRTIGRASRNTRILRFDLASGEVTGEFVYRFEEVCAFIGQAPGCGAAPGDMKLSSMTALSATKLLIDERTDAVAKVYLVDVAAASDILDSQWDQRATSPSLEGTTVLSAAGVTALPKELVVDLSTLPGIPQKIEGISLVNPTLLAIANDNDFGLVDETTFDADGNLSNDTGAKSQIIFVKLPHPLLP